MKKMGIFLILWIAVLSITITVSSQQSKVSYRIWFDSESQNEYETKEKITDIYHELVGDVKDSSKPTMINKSLKAFEYQTDMIAAFQSNTLEITIGNGLGSKIEGRFDEVSCFKEVKPKSWILEMLQGK